MSQDKSLLVIRSGSFKGYILEVLQPRNSAGQPHQQHMDCFLRLNVDGVDRDVRTTFHGSPSSIGMLWLMRDILIGMTVQADVRILKNVLYYFNEAYITDIFAIRELSRCHQHG